MKGSIRRGSNVRTQFMMMSKYKETCLLWRGVRIMEVLWRGLLSPVNENVNASVHCTSCIHSGFSKM